MEAGGARAAYRPRAPASERIPLRTAASLARKTSGAPMTRMATYPTVHGPTPAKRQELGLKPGEVVAVAKVQVPGGHCRGGRRDGVYSPLRAAQQLQAGLRDLAGRREQPVQAVRRSSARAAGRGKLVRAVRAAATVICCPIMARTRSSCGSRAPGIRMPGVPATAAASRGSAPRAPSMATGSASRSNRRRTRLSREARSLRSTAPMVSTQRAARAAGVVVHPETGIASTRHGASAARHAGSKSTIRRRRLTNHA